MKKLIIDKKVEEAHTKIDKTGTLSYFIKFPINDENLLVEEELKYY